MNNSNIDKETYDKLLGALEGMKEMTQKAQAKRELKIWSEISVPITIKDALARLSKDDLSIIRRRLDIKGASQLKKGDLIELLSSKIPFALEKQCMYMDQEQYNLIKRIIRNGGYMEEPKLTANQLNYFRDIGILYTGTFDGKRIIALPEEIVQNQFLQENHKPLIAICRRNTEWIKLTQGLLYYYGTLTIVELQSLLEKYTNGPVQLSDYLSVIEQAVSYYEQIRMDKTGFSNIRVFDPEKVILEHKMRKDVEFFPYSKEQILRAGEVDYIERNDSYLQFVHFLTQNYEMTKQEADDIVSECVYATNIGEGPNEIVKFLQSRIELPTLESLRDTMDMLVNLMNHTKQWVLKGYTPKELSAHKQQFTQVLPKNKDNIIDFTTKKKIGRNDPCPCGSNKKFKKCCGR
ncbi:YecA family protein [Bacillus sp. USDA818B3_A]|uniref:YecA family protein n=1 Tax=Bacillus sp. USDA818B3_A TaxID=2698834 RepID=UPI001370B5B6|nr:SEC-C metal-binding domain-containing protein [Bacillus sp. USDA818B3_A]